MTIGSSRTLPKPSKTKLVDLGSGASSTASSRKSSNTSSNSSQSCSGCSNCCCDNDKYEISQEALDEIAAFEAFLAKFHLKQQQQQNAVPQPRKSGNMKTLERQKKVEDSNWKVAFSCCVFWARPFLFMWLWFVYYSPYYILTFELQSKWPHHPLFAHDAFRLLFQMLFLHYDNEIYYDDYLYSWIHVLLWACLWCLKFALMLIKLKIPSFRFFVDARIRSLLEFSTMNSKIKAVFENTSTPQKKHLTQSKTPRVQHFLSKSIFMYLNFPALCKSALWKKTRLTVKPSFFGNAPRSVNTFITKIFQNVETRKVKNSVKSQQC